VIRKTALSRPTYRAEALRPDEWPNSAPLLDCVPKPVGEDVADVFIGEAVVDDPACLAALNDAARSEQSKLMAHRGLAHPDQQGKIADAELFGKAEGMQDAGAVRIGEQSEDLRDALGIGRREHSVEQGGDVLRMQTFDANSGQLKLETPTES
jgi:hypothetical protein